jgi:signal-transduction protein with cAMP-binding, CBS, and nucleotidyltransferase domain
MLTRIESVLNWKGRDAWSVPACGTVRDALSLMVEKRIEALVVLSDGKVVGVLTERDCARRVALQGRDPSRVRVSDVMTSPALFVSERHTIGDCMSIMSARGFAHLPVLDGDDLVGVISMGDLVASLVRERDDAIRHLETYITGAYPA